MSGTKALVIGGLVVAGMILIISAIFSLVSWTVTTLISVAPYVLMFVGATATARWLVRQFRSENPLEDNPENPASSN